MRWLMFFFRYVSSALDHLAALRAGFDGGFDRFAIFEDDLMLGAAPAILRERLSEALQSAPVTADMLYLEGCHDMCVERRYSSLYPHWARTLGPSCSAAIVFTRKGARRLSLLDLLINLPLPLPASQPTHLLAPAAFLLSLNGSLRPSFRLSFPNGLAHCNTAQGAAALQDHLLGNRQYVPGLSYRIFE
jgi:hypothetical protein